MEPNFPELTDWFYNLDNSSEFARSFKNFDDPAVFEQAGKDIRNPTTRNFVVDFGDDEAYCAFNLTSEEFEGILATERPASLHTRWINIWLPYKQKDILHAIARNYDFSPRLLALMCTDPFIRLSKGTPQSSHTSVFRRSLRGSSHKSSKDSIDLEKVAASIITDGSQASESDHQQAITNHYEIVSEVWHWSSVDVGRKFVCLGYNSLYAAKLASPTQQGEPEVLPDLPEGTRVWTWLLLCEDKTVITVREDPFPLSHGFVDSQERTVTLAIRRNLVNVFQQLSKVHDSSRESPMTLLPIRKRVGQSEQETAHRPSDSPGLLFFYLFEDWFSAFNLVARREHRYEAELNRLRECMLVKPELEHVNRLHHIGRQLSVLKRLYQSYELLIDRILEKQEVTLASLKNSNFMTGPNSLSASHAQLLEPGALLGVPLSSAARVRFARLKNNIRLYALTEIQECLDQRDALVMMNFNMIAIKESYSVERLTRITLLLAKLTMLFMPVSLMTAYFSTQLENVQFSLRSYWIAFGIIFGLSCLGLAVFSFISGTMEGKMVEKSMTRSALDASKSYMERKGRKEEEE